MDIPSWALFVIIICFIPVLLSVIFFLFTVSILLLPLMIGGALFFMWIVADPQGFYSSGHIFIYILAFYGLFALVVKFFDKIQERKNKEKFDKEQSYQKEK